ncbi:MAG: hypothetical protein ACYSW7_02600 [Planctomycetota bacterium]
MFTHALPPMGKRPMLPEKMIIIALSPSQPTDRNQTFQPPNRGRFTKSVTEGMTRVHRQTGGHIEEYNETLSGGSGLARNSSRAIRSS